MPPRKIPQLKNSKLSLVGVLIFALVFGTIGARIIFQGHASTSTLTGDLNGDCTVNILDLSMLLSHWQQTGTNVVGDINGDNIVNILDLSSLLTHWNNACAQPPVNTVVPTISGATVVGSGLSATTGTWSNSPTGYSYQWQDCPASGGTCSNISGAVNSTYTLQAADAGHTIDVTVTATNASGSASATSARTAAVTSASTTGFVAGGWWPAWETGVPLSSVPWNAINQIYEFSDVTSASSPFLVTTTHGVSPSQQQALVAAAHQHNVQAILTVGGSDDQHWSTACTSANRATFINSMISQMQTYGYDGIDLDIEEGTFIGTADFNACVPAIYNGFKAVATNAGKAPLVTIDTDPSWMEGYEAPLYPYIDQFNFMGYGSTCANSCSAVANFVAEYTSRGVPASKIAQGIGLDPGMPQATNTADCSLQAQWASTHGVGIMYWSIQDDPLNHSGAYPCVSSTAPYL